jgi:Mrp family chromosome partitioning ATPase
MSVRPEHTPILDPASEPVGPHRRSVHAEAARRVHGHGHALARRALQAIAREATHAPMEWIAPASPVAPREVTAPALPLPRHSLEATFAALAAAGARALLATGPERGVGTSSFVEAAGRAIAGSNLGSVVLVDADARHPALHRRFGLGCGRGLAEALDELYAFDITREEGSQFGIGDWLEVLRAQGRTGRLIVRGDGRTYVIEIVRGRVGALTSADAGSAWRLGDRLLQRGVITGEQRDAAGRIHEQTGRPIGEVLSALGFIDPRDLVEPLQQQCVRGLVEMIAMHAPECRFDERAESHVCGAGSGRSALPGASGLDRLFGGRVLEFLRQPFLHSQTPSFLRDTDTEGLKVLVAGGHGCDLSTPARQVAFGLLLARLARAFDFVLVDAPAAGPPGAGGISPAIAAHADGVLMVVPADSAASTGARRAIEDFRRAGARVLGVVMNQAGSRRRS